MNKMQLGSDFKALVTIVPVDLVALGVLVIYRYKFYTPSRGAI